MHSKRKSSGFTLVELAITMVVLAILAAIAYPVYQDQLRKGRRGTVQAFLIETANRQQQYLLDARGYAVGASALSSLNLTVPGDVAPYYTITVQPAAATVPPTYTLIATPSGAQVGDDVLTLDHEGNKTRAGVPGW